MGTGLDTRGVVDGFARGFGMVDGYYDKEADRARRDRLDQQQAEHRQQQQDNWQQSFDAREAHRQQQQDNWQTSHDATEAQRAKAHGLQMQQAKRAENHREWSRGRAESQDAIAANERQHKQNLEYIQQAWIAAEQGVPFDHRFYEIVSQPRYGNLDPRRLISEEAGAAISQGKRVADPNDPAGLNDPETLDGVNFLFNYDINSDRQGQPLDGHRRLVGLFPGGRQGTVVGEVETDDGRRNPMTEGRGADDIVLQQPVDAMIHKLASADMLRQFLQSERGQAVLVNMGRSQGLLSKPPKAEYQLIQGKDVEGNSVALGSFNKRTGDFSPYRNTDDQGSGSNSLPSAERLQGSRSVLNADKQSQQAKAEESQRTALQAKPLEGVINFGKSVREGTVGQGLMEPPSDDAYLAAQWRSTVVSYLYSDQLPPKELLEKAWPHLDTKQQSKIKRLAASR